jgi:hypothetical protein
MRFIGSNKCNYKNAIFLGKEVEAGTAKQKN